MKPEPSKQPKMADTLYHAMICVCLGALLLACHSGYRLLAPPAPTDEMFGIYDGLIKKRVRTGKSSTVIYYIKLKDTPSLIRPDNDDRTIQRLKRTRYGSGLWITKKTKLSTPRAEPAHYRAIALYSNNKIYDHRDTQEADRRSTKRTLIKALAVFVASILALRYLRKTSSPSDERHGR